MGPTGMANRQKYWFKRKDGEWGHGSPVKTIINPILKWVQKPLTDRPWLIASMSSEPFDDPTQPPVFIKYVFTRVQLSMNAPTLSVSLIVLINKRNGDVVAVAMDDDKLADQEAWAKLLPINFEKDQLRLKRTTAYFQSDY